MGGVETQRVMQVSVDASPTGQGDPSGTFAVAAGPGLPHVVIEVRFVAGDGDLAASVLASAVAEAARRVGAAAGV